MARLSVSPLGAALSEEFARDGSTATVSFGGSFAALANDTTVVVRLDGVTSADPASRPMRVVLDRRLAREGSESAAAAALARELFGRVLEYQRAAGRLSPQAVDLYAESDLRASAIGWIVALELGAPGDFSELRRWLDDEDDYRRDRAWSSPERIVMLGPEDLDDPAQAYLGRLQDADRARERGASAEPGPAAAALRRREAEVRSGELGGLIAESSGEEARAYYRTVDARLAALRERARALLSRADSPGR